ncbi:hypothetical protein R1flu_017387 [Riccia fluitans]|uniref:Uncharacterized protein n=1 Tax=Riccia fluitans TaxID=41844 RepID=A0ABD1ZCU4_9MARC
MGSKRRSPPDLPGMYFDVERNRYFPLRGGAAGGNSRVKTEADQIRRNEELARIQREESLLRKARIPKAAFAGVEKAEDGNTVFSLLRQRELSGHSWKTKTGTNSFDFQRQILETDIKSLNFKQQPEIRSYGYDVPCEGGIEQCQLELQTGEGLIKVDAMMAAGRHFLHTLRVCRPGDASVLGSAPSATGDLLPRTRLEGGHIPSEAPVLRPIFAKVGCTSMITSVKKLNQWRDDDNSRLAENVIFTTLGVGKEGGLVHLMPTRQETFFVDQYYPSVSRSRVRFNSDVYTAACNPRGKQASVGLTKGSAVLDIERDEVVSLLISKSSAQAQEFDNMGNVVVCGHRNGTILTYDLRRPLSVGQHGRRESRNHHEKMQMGSAISSISLLRRNEQYLIASAVNGEMWQWDRRLTGRGPVQTFEGHVNTHHPLKFRLDPSERILAAGGMDFTLRLWSVTSGRLLHVERNLGCIPKTVCWNYSYCTSNTDRRDLGLDDSEAYPEKVKNSRQTLRGYLQ